MGERRKWPRLAWSAKGRAFFGNAEVPCSVIDVSLAGMGIISPRTAMLGTFVRVQWSAPGGEWTDVDGILVRTHERSSSEWVWGIRLEHLSPHIAARISALASSVPPPKPPSAPVHARPPATQLRAAPPQSLPASRRPSAPVHPAAAASPVRPPPPAKSSRIQQAISNQELAQLFREALEAHEPNKPRKKT